MASSLAAVASSSSSSVAAAAAAAAEVQASLPEQELTQCSHGSAEQTGAGAGTRHSCSQTAVEAAAGSARRTRAAVRRCSTYTFTSSRPSPLLILLLLLLLESLSPHLLHGPPHRQPLHLSFSSRSFLLPSAAAADAPLSSPPGSSTPSSSDSPSTLAPSTSTSSANHDLECQSIADTYFDHHHREPIPYDGTNMAYFLHVPRTAGRTFHTCFLKLGMPQRRQCPNTYDHLRINVTMPNCYLLSSHDDFSVVSLLPDNVSVMTHIRDPVERFLSAYEFAIEVASRTFQRSGPPPRKDPRRIATEDVWPWSFLVPFFVADMKARRSNLLEQAPAEGHWIEVTGPHNEKFFHNRKKELSKWNLTAEERQLLLPPLDPYGGPLAMSLEEFVEHPIARELLHDGQAYQVLGITNYSHWGDAGHMRQCMWRSPTARQHLLDVAVRRVNKFFHVGVTDRLADSVAAAGVAMKYHMTQQIPKTPPARGSAATFATTSSPAADKLAEAGGNAELAGVLKQLQDSISQGLSEMQSLKEQLFESNQQGRIGAEKAELENKISETRRLLVTKQTALTQLTANLSASSNATSTGAAPGMLGFEFYKCARSAQQKNLERRSRSFSHVFMPDGRQLKFYRGARKNIPERVLEKIRQHNPMDVRLHAEAERLLTERRQQWSQQGLLEELPKINPAPIPDLPIQLALKIPLPKEGQQVDSSHDTL